jgi:hypothetical protein
MKTIKQQVKQEFGHVCWYFEIEGVAYGLAKKDGKFYGLAYDKLQHKCIIKNGMLEHFSPTPKMTRAIKKAIGWAKS